MGRSSAAARPYRGAPPRRSQTGYASWIACPASSRVHGAAVGVRCAIEASDRRGAAAGGEPAPLAALHGDAGPTGREAPDHHARRGPVRLRHPGPARARLPRAACSPSRSATRTARSSARRGRAVTELPYYTNWTYAHPRAIELAAKLAELTPANIQRSFFVSGGSEAVESAIKLAREYHAQRRADAAQGDRARRSRTTAPPTARSR